MLRTAAEALKEKDATDELIWFSLRGHMLHLPKKTLMKHDWIVSQMLSPDFPFNVKQNDQYYLDCDAASFRLILAIIQGEAKVNLEAARLSSTDLELLKATARFLLCSDIEKEIEVIASERAKAEALLQSQISDLTRAQEELTTKLKLFEYRDNASIYGIWPIVLICENFRQFRPNNICGTQMLLLGANGAAYKEKKDYLRCSNCGGNFTLRILEYRV